MKKLLTVLICALLAVQCFAQPVPLSGGGDTSYTPPAYADINTGYRTYANNVFGLLEASRVPTGFYQRVSNLPKVGNPAHYANNVFGLPEANRVPTSLLPDYALTNCI